MKRFAEVALLTILIVSSQISVAAVTRGSISGVVLNPQGLPLANASVAIRSASHRQAETRMVVKTDKSGVFTIDSCPLGDYMVSVVYWKVERSATGETSSVLPLLTTLTLSAIAPNAKVSLQFGRDVQVLSGTIKDKTTGQPLSAILELKSADSARSWLISGLPAKFRIQVPKTGNLSLAVSAPGYQTWYSSKLSDALKRTDSETIKSLELFLQPLPK